MRRRGRGDGESLARPRVAPLTVGVLVGSLLMLGSIGCREVSRKGGEELSAPPEIDFPVIKVLAIDGGGARGIIPALVLAEIERRSGAPIHELFDVIAGTSTGSLIAGMATAPPPGGGEIRTAAEIVSFYEGEGAKLFFARDPGYLEKARSFEVPAYPASSHIAGIQAAIDSETMLSEAAANVTITSYNLTEDPPRTYDFTRYKARHGDPEDGSPASDHEFRFWEVIRGASTFPGIWPGATLTSVGGKEHYPLDGGLFAINPALEGLAHALDLVRFRGEDADSYRFMLVSLGTGFYNQTALVGEQTQAWGPLQWYRQGAVPPMVEVLFEGQTDSVAQLMQQIGADGGVVRHYFRFQPRMERDFQLDDVDPKTIATLRAYAEAMIAERGDDLAEISRLLAVGRGLSE